MVSKCCWRENAKRSPETEIKGSQDGRPENCQDTESNGSTTALICTYEDDCDKHLEITDLTVEGKNHQNATGSCICSENYLELLWIVVVANF